MKNLTSFLTPLLSCLLLVLSITTAGLAQASNGEMSKAVTSKAHDKLEWIACPAPLDFDGCNITILNGDPTQPNTDLLFKMEGGTVAPEHWHSSAERMVLISGELHVTYTGEETQVLKPGTYAYGPAEKPHVAECVGKKPCVLFIAFEKPVDTHVDNE